MRHRRIGVGLVVAVLAGALVSPAYARTGIDPAGMTAASPGLGLGAATVSVSVATVWKRPSSARSVDAPALANPVRVRAWLAGMTLSQRRALSGRAVTQVVLGERVRVV